MRSLPTGTVTLLFTDVVGGTRHWQQHRATMHEASSRHGTLLRAAIEAHGGAVFKTAGDGVCAAFATATDALQAALTIQRSIRAEDWGALGEILVRTAVHTGAVESRDGDYFGLALGRTARLLAAGHGGQILLSLAAHELTCDSLPPEIALRSLGRHQLKDLARPEQIFQAVAPDLPADFPPLDTLDGRPHNLPVQATPLVGREREVAQGLALLTRPEVRLLTLTGPGGVGKTRLALQLAAEMVDAYADGVRFVNLAPVSDPALVAPTIAQTLGVREAGGTPLVQLLKEYLRERELLLVLDNFEQVVSVSALVSELLAAAPRVTLLVTSRTTLRLYGEHEFAVPPLSLPEPKRLSPLERMTQYEAVRLFIERARAVKADFSVTNANAPAVAEMCTRLDGLPLAIELAAARIKILTPEALLGRLQRRLGVLTGGPRDLPARQQTLRNTLDWSFNLLDPAEQQLFARLGVFVGGCTLEAAEAVCNPDGELGFDTLDGVGSLLDKSLLRQDDGPGGQSRLVMLETIHEYAREKLEQSGEAEKIRRRHADVFTALAEAAKLYIEGAQSSHWTIILESEHDNLRATLSWSLRQTEFERALRIGEGLWLFWINRGFLAEGRRWLDLALEHAHLAPPLLRARVLTYAGDLATFHGDAATARTLLAEGIDLLRQYGDLVYTGYALISLGNLYLLEEDYSTAQAFYEESLELQRVSGDVNGLIRALGSLAEVARCQRDLVRAKILLEEVLALCPPSGTLYLATQINRGLVALETNDYATVRLLFSECLQLSHESGDLHDIVLSFVGLSWSAAADGQFARAATILGAASRLHEVSEMVFSPADHVVYTQVAEAIRAQLPQAAFDAAYATGRAMPLEEAITLALEPPPEPSVPAAPSPPVLPGGLSEREAEVLRLVAQGLTNAQIAERLVLSPFTVNAHLRTIYGKIGVHTRAAATRWAAERGLV